ncbi:dipeptidase [Dielma fastidiosa]|uniref:Membrane dipeptidase n=1 Tax=Dielma fastidiosa TaxID=1034346 RepID=A0A318KK93_9FIRM|nr:membrane dipeptidase [Dielma fastidiosa]PXX78251.1 membrane dipeptidase [Dielma fastidiosa]
MKFFDLHADIGDDVVKKHLNHETHVLKRYHLDKLRQGGFEGVCMASFFDGHETWQDMQLEILALEAELNESNDFVRVLNAEDLCSNKIKALMSVEGMCGILDDEVNKIQWLYDHGIRLATLTWNEGNALANGVKGQADKGLSAKGKNVIHKMNQLHMIADVSHANEKTFWDIMNLSDGLVIASHSNCRTLCNHPRNLDDEQCLAIKAKGGLIGMNSARYFVDQNEANQTVAKLAEHAAYLKTLVGVETIACGFDFMDFFEDGIGTAAKGIETALDAPRFALALADAGFSELEIEKICYTNVIEKFSSYLK